MKVADKPTNEDARIAELRSYDILDTSPETAYDDLTSIAAQIFGVPTALVSLVDAERQWFKSHHGLDATETPRDFAFCAHAILEPGRPFVVPNASADTRFFDNPLVTEDPAIRFYAGAPLVTPRGHALGTLCVIAPDALEPTDAQLQALSALARQVVTQLELRRAGQAERSARREAEQANRSKDDFLATMSHELRTPMNAVIGCAELLRDSPLATDQQKNVGLILDAGELLLGVIEDILDLRKIEEGKLRLKTEAVAADAALNQALAMLTPHAQIKGVELGVDITGGLPALHADPMRLKQVVLNLVGNAIKFTEEGRVLVRARAVGERVRIEVQDNGIGISPDRVPLLFERFRQADAGVARRYGGSGLGLAICKDLVQMMGGRIGCDSELGRGSVFWFELPTTTAAVEPNRRTEPPQEAIKSTSKPASRPLSGMRVLVVEDNIVNQKIVASMLAKLGCETALADSGEQGLALSKRQRFDAILMDRHLPEKDGVETTRAILAALGQAAPPILALTATGTENDEQACLAAGMVAYLTKPIRSKALEHALGELPQAASGVKGS